MAGPDTAHLRPDKIAVWPVEDDRYGIDVSYAGATGYTRADQAHQTINANGMNATFRQELGDMWTVRRGSLARDAIVLVVERYAEPKPRAVARRRLGTRSGRRSRGSLAFTDAQATNASSTPTLLVQGTSGLSSGRACARTLGERECHSLPSGARRACGAVAPLARTAAAFELGQSDAVGATTCPAAAGARHGR